MRPVFQTHSGIAGEEMKIHGFQKTTLLDYPGHVAATVFTGGCNFRCPFCQNGSLVLEPEGQPLLSEEEVLAHLKKRRNVLEGVCITGGEPTLDPGLKRFILQCRELGLLVKLDTNGYRPELLGQFLQEGILDYVAMDVKASPENYGRATGCPGFDVGKIRESIRLLQTGGISYEFRTTAVRGIHSVEEFEEIGKLLQGSAAYYLQAYRDGGDVLGMRNRFLKEESSARETERMPGVKGSFQEEERIPGAEGSFQEEERIPGAEGSFQETERTPGADRSAGNGIMEAFSRKEMEEMAALAGKYMDKVELRGVE